MTKSFPQLLKLRLAYPLWLCQKHTQQKRTGESVNRFQRFVGNWSASPWPQAGRAMDGLAEPAGEKRRKLTSLPTGC